MGFSSPGVMADSAVKKPAAKPAGEAKPAKAAKPAPGERKFKLRRRESKVNPDGTRKINPYKVLHKKKLPAVPEVILRRRKIKKRIKKQQVSQDIRNKKLEHKKRRVTFKRAESYIRKYRTMEAEKLRLMRAAKKEGTVLVPGDAKLAFCIRIRGVNQIHPKVRKVLQLLRLLQINNGVFVMLNKATLSMLRIAEPFITWGYPNIRSIKNLIYKRGFAKVNGRRTALFTNEIVEKNLGHAGIVCVEDLVHEIYTQGKHFQKVNNFLWSFKLNNPKGGWRMKTKHFVEGGDFGNRENKLNGLLAKMI